MSYESVKALLSGVSILLVAQLMEYLLSGAMLGWSFTF